jgi:D-3-phosphoglycerate dehydrogenase
MTRAATFTKNIQAKPSYTLYELECNPRFCTLTHQYIQEHITVVMSTPAQSISVPGRRQEESHANTQFVSSSPTSTFHSPPSSFSGSQFARRPAPAPAAKQLKPFDTQDVKILLLENVNKTGIDILEGQGYQVESIKTSLPEDELIEKIR